MGETHGSCYREVHLLYRLHRLWTGRLRKLSPPVDKQWRWKYEPGRNSGTGNGGRGERCALVHGHVRVTGDQSAVDRWLPTIRDNKPSILRELHRELRREKVLALLEAQADKRYAIYVSDASTDPVVVAVGVRNSPPSRWRSPSSITTVWSCWSSLKNMASKNKPIPEEALVALNAILARNTGSRQGCNRRNMSNSITITAPRINLCLIVLSLGVASQ